MLRSRSSRWFGPLVGSCLLLGCEKSDPPTPTPQRASSVAPRTASTELPQEVKGQAPPAPDETPAPEPTAWSVFPSFPPDYQGAWFYVTSLGAGVYNEPAFERSEKLGYLRHGGKVPVKAEPVSKKDCKGGWYEIQGGGYICGNLGTTKGDDPRVKFGTTPPKLDDVLPYPYARNAKHGTPLYKSVPSREQMEHYEPYLVKDKKDAGAEQKKAESEKADKADKAEETDKKNPASDQKKPDSVAASADANAKTQYASDTVSAASVAPGVGAGGVVNGPAAPSGMGEPLADPGLAAEEPEPETPWWQRENIKDELHKVKLDELESEADEILAKRMVTGFYIAVDRTFRWNNRAWYKTTRGLITPVERFWQTAGPKFQGVELDGQALKLPIGWVYGGRKKDGTYSIDPETQAIKNAKTVEKFVALPLAGESITVNKTRYERLADGSYIKRAHIQMTEPGPLPSDLGPDERWIDINLSTQTLVAFVGPRPVYATMISSGKESKIKDKDHRTPTGEWHIREKHVTTTMDGDGTAAGDLPYSIEDVPYVMYFHRAFAIHGAFWHNNFGIRMSHGCVNLAPLDAKYLFFFTDPVIPAGYHGVFAQKKTPGTRVVVHE